MDVKLTGLVLKNVPVGDNKSIVTLLTKERGKTVMTCHGARKLTSRNMAPTRLFALAEYIAGEKNGRLTLKESALLESCKFIFAVRTLGLLVVVEVIVFHGCS